MLDLLPVALGLLGVAIAFDARQNCRRKRRLAYRLAHRRKQVFISRAQMPARALQIHPEKEARTYWFKSLDLLLIENLLSSYSAEDTRALASVIARHARGRSPEAVELTDAQMTQLLTLLSSVPSWHALSYDAGLLLGELSVQLLERARAQGV